MTLITSAATRADLAPRTKTRTRPSLGQPHRFESNGAANVRSQCAHCYGWYDDPRHLDVRAAFPGSGADRPASAPLR